MVDGGLPSREQRVSGFVRYEQHRQRRRNQADEAAGPQADAMSFSSIEREMGTAKFSDSSAGTPPLSRVVSISSGGFDSKSTSMRRIAVATLGLSRVGMRSIVPPLHHPTGADVARGSLAPAVNKRVRRTLLTQGYFSNRFRGSPVADEAEAEYQRFVSQYHRSTVVRRLVQCAVLLAAGSVYDTVVSERAFRFILLRTVVPVVLLLCGAAACVAGATRRWWRLVVVAVAVCSYTSILAAEATFDVGGWSACSKDYNSAWQLLWVLLAMGSTALFFALDVSHAAVALALQWAVRPNM